MNEELIKLLQYRIAEGATGPSALRNQGNKGVLVAARSFLKAIDLFEFSVTTEQQFDSVLGAHTNDLKISFPKGARHWGSARKALNLFLRDVLYNRYLSRHFSFGQIEKWLEIPLDSYAAKAIRRSYGIKDLPSWKGIKYLTPEASQAYQDAATMLASTSGFARVHLDVLYWRGVGQSSSLASDLPHQIRKKRRVPVTSNSKPKSIKPRSQTNRALEAEFHEEMISIYYKAGHETGYWANRFLQKVRKDGGLQAARQWLSPEKGLSPGLQRLTKEKRVDLSMEALILKDPWKELFTKEEINEARKRIEVVSKMAAVWNKRSK